jgi:hypothetical protein
MNELISPCRVAFESGRSSHLLVYERSQFVSASDLVLQKPFEMLMYCHELSLNRALPVISRLGL